MPMERVVPEWSGLEVPVHLVHLAPLPATLPGQDDGLPALVDPEEWSTFKTDKRRMEHLGGRLLLAASMDAWWRMHRFLGRVDELDVCSGMCGRVDCDPAALRAAAEAGS